MRNQLCLRAQVRHTAPCHLEPCDEALVRFCYAPIAEVEDRQRSTRQDQRMDQGLQYPFHWSVSAGLAIENMETQQIMWPFTCARGAAKHKRSRFDPTRQEQFFLQDGATGSKRGDMKKARVQGSKESESRKQASSQGKMGRSWALETLRVRHPKSKRSKTVIEKS